MATLILLKEESVLCTANSVEELKKELENRGATNIVISKNEDVKKLLKESSSLVDSEDSDVVYNYAQYVNRKTKNIEDLVEALSELSFAEKRQEYFYVYFYNSCGMLDWYILCLLQNVSVK